MEYIFTNLPQYIRITPQSAFTSSIVESGHALLFMPTSSSVMAKLPDGSFITVGGSGTDVSSTTAEAADVLSGKVFYNSAGTLTSGGIQIQSGQTITPTTSNQIISSGVYLGGSQTILGDSSLVASNIVSGASIFGVIGTAQSGSGTDVSDTTAEAGDVLSGKIFYTSGGTQTSGTIPNVSAYAYNNICVVPSGYISSQQEIEVGSAVVDGRITPTTSNQIVSAGGFLLGDLTVEGDAALVASNIVSGVSIFGVSGTYAGSSGAEVTLGYITSGGKFQPLAFSGTSAADSGSAVTLSCYSWNKPSITSGGVVVSSGMSFYVNSGYNYVSNTVNSFGFMYVMSGGTATNTQVDTVGFLIVSSGGTAAGVSNFFGGGFRVLDGGSAYDFNVLSMSFDFSPQTYLSGTVGGSQVVVSGTSILPMSTLSGLAVDMKSGTYAHNVTIPADDAQITFSSGASGSGIEIYGSAYIRGGIVISAVVHSGGTAEVWSGGTAGYVTVSSGGTMVIRTGAETGNITSETGAVIIN